MGAFTVCDKLIDFDIKITSKIDNYENIFFEMAKNSSLTTIEDDKPS